MMRNTVCLLLVCGGFISGPATVSGAEWAWIEFSGAPPGSAPDPAHEGWSAVEGFGVDTVIGKGQAGSFQVVRAPDSNSPWLFLALVSGENIPKVRVDVAASADSRDEVFVRLELEEVRVVDKTMAQAGMNHPPQEILSLAFTKIRYRYLYPSAEGGGGLFTEFDYNAGTGRFGLIPGERRLTLTRLTDEPGMMRLSWRTEPGQTYEIEWSPDLIMPFEHLRTVTAGGDWYEFDFSMTGRTGFYRVRIP